jgi:hypothetical protein
MHADPLDRIGPATLTQTEAASDLSVPLAALFARAITLPFAHPLRWLACGFIPCCLLAGDACVLYGKLATERVWPFPNLQEVDPTIAGASNPTALLAISVGWPLVFLCAVGFWFCAWQRDVARHFKDPIGRLLSRSLPRLPGYLAASALWLIGPSAIIGAVDAVVLRAGLSSISSLEEFWMLPWTEPMRVWLVLAGWAVALLFGLWLFARLSPLPALVAVQGWRGALGTAWNLSEGHGLGLTLAFFVYGILGGLLSGFGMFSAAMVFRFGPWEAPRAATAAAFTIAAVGFIAMLITQFWCTSLAALTVKESVRIGADVDPATFD